MNDIKIVGTNAIHQRAKSEAGPRDPHQMAKNIDILH